MANETVYSGLQVVAAYLEAEAVPFFRAATIMANLTRQVPFTKGSASKKLVQAGSLTATAASEATDHANSQYTTSSPNTLTAAEVKVFIEVSKKTMKFTDLDMEALAMECGAAIATKYDADAMALFDGFSNSVGSTGVDLTPAVMAAAAYTLRLNNIQGPYVYVLHPTAHFDVQANILSSGASVYTNPAFVSFLGAQPAANGYVGNLFDVNVFVSTNTESINSGADWGCACFSPQFAIAAGYAGEIEVEQDNDIKKGVAQLSASLFYDFKEHKDTAGCLILADQ